MITISGDCKRRQMKILMITWQFPPLAWGGVGSACFGIVQALAERGIQTYLLIPWLRGGYYIISSAADLKDIHTRLQTDSSERDVDFPSLEYSFSSTWDAEKLLEGVDFSTIRLPRDFDIIHCHDWITFPFARKIKKVSGKPVLLHIHSLEPDRNPHFKNPFISRLENEAVSEADAVLCVSAFTKERLLEEYPAINAPVHIVYNGYYLPSESYIDGPSGGRETVILFLGRMTEQKGPDVLLHAAKKIVEYRKDTIFLFAGSGPMEPFLQQLNADSFNSDRIRFTGFVSHQQAAFLLHKADILVIPSISEPFSIAALEALSSGTVVLLPRRAGAAEIAESVIPMDPMRSEDIEAALNYLLDNPEVMNKLKQEGTEEAKNFSWRKSIDSLIAVYEKYVRR